MWNICRTCMSKGGELISIFDQSKSPPIYTMLMAITSLEILPKDSLPSQICDTCYETIGLTYSFKEQVIRCNNALQKQAQTKLLAHQQVTEVVKIEKIEEEYNDQIEYVTIDDAQARNDSLSESDIKGWQGTCSSDIKDVNSHFEEIDIKTEEVDIEEHDMPFEDNCEVSPQQIMIKNDAAVEFCSEDDVPLMRFNVSESYQETQVVQRYTCENGAGGKKVSKGLKTDTSDHMPKTYECEVCGKSVARPSKLKIHMRKHTGERPFKCQQCPATFAQVSNLNKHIRMHAGVTPKRHKCAVCDKVFESPCHLKVHMRSHTGERPFKCQQCSASFMQRSNLVYHIRTHTGERPFQCPHCDVTYPRASDLKRHIRLHTGEATPRPHKCDACDKSFSTATRLKIHTRTHTGEKPFECQQCKTRFTQIGNLNAHLRLHAGDAMR